MSKAAFIGGFSNGEKSAEEVGRALEPHFEDIDVFTFPYALDNPDVIKKAVRDRLVVAHSAGMLALHDEVRPQEVHSFGAPLPASRTALVARTGLKSAQMYGRTRSLDDLAAANRFHVRSTAQLLGPRTAKGHWKPFLDGRISKFNALTAAEGLNDQAGARVGLNYGDRDRYYRPTQEMIDRAATLPGVSINMLPDQTHDDLVLHPEEVIDEYLPKHVK